MQSGAEHGGDFVARVATGLAALRPAPGDTWVVACSGGPDSLALLVATAEAAPSLGVRLVAVYVDHGLRPEAADEGVFVARIAARLGATSRTVRVDAKGRAARDRRSLMEAARLERHEALGRVADEVGATRVLLGHTADDQVETVLMRLGRGTGVRGLRGMAAQRGRIARPMLDLTRAEVEELLRSKGLEPVRDPGNADRRFLRSVVRHDLLPILRERLPTIDHDLLALAAAARTLTATIDAEVEVEGTSPADLELVALREARPEVRRARLERAFRRAGGAGLCAAHVAAIERLLESERGTRGVDLPGLIRAERRYGTLCFLRPSPAGHGDNQVLVSGQGRYSFLGHELLVESCTAAVEPGSNMDDGCHVVCFDLDALEPPLVLRAPRPGDRIRPRGFGHRRKVSDVLGEARVPAPERSAWPLLADAREVLLVVGLRAAETGRPGPATTRAIRIVARKANSAVRL